MFWLRLEIIPSFASHPARLSEGERRNVRRMKKTCTTRPGGRKRSDARNKITVNEKRTVLTTCRKLWSVEQERGSERQTRNCCSVKVPLSHELWFLGVRAERKIRLCAVAFPPLRVTISHGGITLRCCQWIKSGFEWKLDWFLRGTRIGVLSWLF